MRSAQRTLVIAGLIYGLALSCFAQEQVLRVAKLATPPTIDGTLKDAEWDQACAMNGFQGAISQTTYPEWLRMIWYVGYDDTNLYLAMHAIFPDSISLKAEAKAAQQDIEEQLLYDDHVEIQITPYGRERAMRAGYGFYKMMVTPRGIFSDKWYYNGCVGTESLWSSDAKVACTSTKTSWSMEIAWPLTSMKVKSADNTDLTVHLSRAVSGGGWYFASSATGIWLNWDQFYRFSLDPTAPAVRFLRQGDLGEGKLDTQIEVRSPHGAKATAEVAIFDAQGKTLFQETKSLAATPGQPASVNFQAQDLALTPIPDKETPRKVRNQYRLRVRDGNGQLLYTVDAPVAGYTKAYLDRHVQPWLSSRPKVGSHKWDLAYSPSAGKARVMVDLDVFGGLPPTLSAVTQFEAAIMPQGSTKAVAQAIFPIKNKLGKGCVEVGDLAEGTYTCAVRLLDAQKQVLDEKTTTFKRKRYAWENNKLGKERVVIPPFAPLTYADQTIRTQRTAYTMGPMALPSAVQADSLPILDRPIQIEVTAKGQRRPLAGSKATITKGQGRTFPPEFFQYVWRKKCPKKAITDLPETDGYDATVTATGTAAGVKVQVKSVVEYDGWCGVSLTYGPAAGATQIDGLDVVIPLGDFADVMVAGRDYGDQANIGAIPAGKGLVWESRNLVGRPKGFRGTWVPYAYLGSGGRGLWCLAESDEGWLLDDKVSAVQIERHNGKPLLRLRLVNHRATLDKERTVHFSLLATPNKVKPQNSRHRLWVTGAPSGPTATDQSGICWFNSGWRNFGWGGDDFHLPEDADYVRLGDWIEHPEAFKGSTSHPFWTGWLKRKKKAAGEEAWRDEVPVILYSSHSNVSPSLPPLETYGGEWIGTSRLDKFTFAGNRTAMGRTDYLGKYTWDTPAKVGEVTCDYVQSYIDCYIWYHERIFRLARVNGTFYDNAGLRFMHALDAGGAYRREDGHVQPKSNIYARRQVIKRLNTICWLLGQPPMFFPNAGTFDFSFTQKMIGIEGGWYIWSYDGTIFDTWPVTEFRSMVMSKGVAFNIVTAHEAHPKYGYAGTSHRPVRSVLALAILHDVGASRLMDIEAAKSILKPLDEAVGFFDKKLEASFFPYWNQTAVRFVAPGKEGIQPVAPKGMYVSVYCGRDKAVLWLVNETDKGQDPFLWIDDQKLLGRKAKSLKDMETGEEIVPVPRRAWEAEGELAKQSWAHAYVAPQTFRALILE